MMRLRVSPSNPAELRVIAATVADLPPSMHSGLTPGSFSATAPHPLYELSLAHLVAGRGFEWAMRVANRHIIEMADVPFAIADLLPGHSDAAELLALSAGPFAQETCDAINELEQHAGDDQLELRTLRVPALYLVAVWAHGDTIDLLRPLSPTPAPIAPIIYGAPALFALMRSLTNAVGRDPIR